MLSDLHYSYGEVLMKP